MEEHILRAIKDGDVRYLSSLITQEPFLFKNPLTLKDKIVHPLHYACKCKQLEVVQLILNHNSELIHVRDTEGQMPIHIAARIGSTSIVKCLASKQEDLKALIENPGHEDHHKSALDLAMKHSFYDTANEIILQLTANKRRQALFPFIKNGQQALEMLKIRPDLIRPFVRNPRISALIAKDDSCKVTQERIEWYKPGGRRLSFFACIEKREAQITVFTPYTELGKGTFGTVRLFQSPNYQKIAVKSPRYPLDDLSEDEVDREEQSINREAMFNQFAYPEDTPNQVFNFRNDFANRYTNRLIMPFVAGKNIKEYITNQNTSIDIAQIILSVAKELHRIHNVGILHGDLNPQNILLRYKHYRYHVRFIDFGFSYWLTETREMNLDISEGYGLWIPPEICGQDKKIVPVHTNQDVYSLAYILDDALSLGRHYIQDRLMRLYPPIQQFITEGLDLDPDKRPTLESLITNLEPIINMNLGLPACSSSPPSSSHEEPDSSKKARMG